MKNLTSAVVGRRPTTKKTALLGGVADTVQISQNFISDLKLLAGMHKD